MASAGALEYAQEDGGERAYRGEPRVSPDADSAPAEGTTPRRLTALVTDDYPGMRTTLREILEAEGYRVVEAEDGQVALDLLQTRAFDVLILDLAMPRVDGVSVLRQIDTPPPVVIVCSAFSYYDPEIVRSEVGVKVFRYMRKPVSAPELIAAVDEAVAELDR